MEKETTSKTEEQTSEYQRTAKEVITESQPIFDLLARIGGQYIMEARADKLHILAGALSDGLRLLNQRMKSHWGINGERMN